MVLVSKYLIINVTYYFCFLTNFIKKKYSMTLNNMKVATDTTCNGLLLQWV